MIQYIYILAASHSGSTLLAMLLGSHPQIATIGELKLNAQAMGDLNHYRCSCGEFISKCLFWQKVKESIASRGFDFDIACAGTDYRIVESRYARRLLGSMHKGRSLEILRDSALRISPTWRNSLPEIHRKNAAFVSAILEIRGAEIFVDSSKIGLRLKHILMNPELDVKVVRLIRDGRAVALTYMDPANFADAEDPNKRGGGMGGPRESQRLSIDEAAYEWRRSNEEAEHLLHCLNPSQWIEVRYEQLCEDTENTLNRIFEFIGLDPKKRKKDFRTVEHHIVGNGMRLDTTSEVRLDERWREKLTDQELEIFEKTAGKMNRRYGYE